MLIKLSEGSFVKPDAIDAIGYSKAQDAQEPIYKKVAGKDGKRNLVRQAVPAKPESWFMQVGAIRFTITKDDVDHIIKALENK